MDIIRWAINRPVSVTVAVILVVMFGLIGLGAIPIQLTPTVDRPIVTITTRWAGRQPQEIVDNITREQEKRLKNVSNLKRMKSTSRESSVDIELEFYVGSDITRALQEVSDRLRQVPTYPQDVDEPVIKAAEGAAENAVAWMIIDADPKWAADHPEFDITTLFDPLDNEVRPFLERIDGVAEINIYGGREREVRVLLDPVKLAQRRLSALDVIAALRAENSNISAGTIAESKRDYRVRVVGQFVNEQDVLDTIVAYRDADAAGSGAAQRVLKPVYVRDLGNVEIDYQKKRGFVRSMGRPCLAMNCIRQSNANVVDVMRQLRDRLVDVRRDYLPRLGGEAGPHLRLTQVYDETTYIDSAISLVTRNLWQGGLLAALVLLLFLRSFVATGIIALAIPVSVIGTFLVMVAFGRTLNVISLAGLAFAVGMVVDNAIVVLENTVRRERLGDAPRQASYWGAKEVGVAVFASTLTTVAVFIPMLTIREESGQLFRDICLAMATSVLLSMLVALTVVPSACSRLLRPHPPAKSSFRRAAEDLFGVCTVADELVAILGRAIGWLITGWRAYTLRPALILVMAALSVWGSLRLMPPLDYLPTGNRNMVFGGLLIPPGYSVEQQENVAQRIETEVGPYLDADIHDPESVAKLRPIMRFDDPEHPFDPVPVQQMFIGSFGGGMFVGATSQDDQVILPVGNLLTQAMMGVPDAFGGARQSSIFGRGVGGGNSVNVEISGTDLSRVVRAAQFAQSELVSGSKNIFNYGNVQPQPSNYNLSQPEWTVRVNRLGRELGLTTRDVGTAVRALFDGAFIDDFRLADDTVDLVAMPIGGQLAYKEQLASVPIATPSGRVVPVDTVVDITENRAPQEIVRVAERPTISLIVNPPSGFTVQETMDYVRDNVISKAERQGLIDQSMSVRYEGTAASLEQVRASLFGPTPTLSGDRPRWQRMLLIGCIGLAGIGLVVGVVAIIRSFSASGSRVVTTRMGKFPRRTAIRYGALGALLLSLVIGGLLAGVVTEPQLLTARFVWALLVTYLLMCSVFESFLYPLVIMFSVPLAVVGGFAGLRIVHEWTLANPTVPPQQLDVLTMLGFVVLIGTVVNNAILIVEQALNFENPARYGASGEPMPLFRAIPASVTSRIRPIFMTTATTLGGMLPLVIAPGAGSEMYRGLGAVVLGGLVCSTVFTLILVPLVFSVVVDLQEGLRSFFGIPTDTAPEVSPAPVSAAAAPPGLADSARAGGSNGQGRPASAAHPPAESGR